MAFLGMRGTGNWDTYEMPENWRQGILRLFPNGSAPLTAITSMMGSEKTDSPVFHWWTQDFPTQGGTVSVYIDSNLGTVYDYDDHLAVNGQAGATVYCKCTSTVAQMFREGHTVVLRDASNFLVDVTGIVTAVVENSTSSYIAVKLLEVDDNAATSSDTASLKSVDTILVIGNANAEGALIPDTLALNVSENYNNTQIWRTPLELTRTALQTHLRTEDAYKRAKKEALLLHSIEMEKSILHSIRTSGTGSNGKPLRTSLGIIPWVKAGASANVDDYTVNTDYSSDAWITGGEDWFDSMLELVFRYGSDDKLALCGSGAMLGIQQLAKATGQIQLTPTSAAYGLKVNSWLTPFGVIHLKIHPLFSFEATTRHSMLILEPKNLKWRPIQDTTYLKEDRKKTGRYGYDGIKEEFLTEGGYELHHPATFAYLNGVGQDNSL